MNIEDRLARDAARWREDDSAPSFDVLLTDATRARRPRVAVLAVAATVAVIGAVVAAMLIRPWHDASEPAAGGGHPRSYTDLFSGSAAAPSTGPLQRYRQSNIGFDAVVRRPGDPTTIVLMVPGNNDETCSVADPVATISKDSAESLTIVVSGAELLPRVTGKRDVGFSCAAPPDAALTVHLPAALGTRSVYDGQNKSPLPVLDPAELPVPSYLPSGYLPDGAAEPIDAAIGRLLGERAYRNGTERIVITVGAKDALDPDGPTSSHVTVHGHLADVSTNGGTCVAWLVRPSVEQRVCALGDPNGRLSTSELVKVVRSLP